MAVHAEDGRVLEPRQIRATVGPGLGGQSNVRIKPG
jgi:hypothetical protein